MVPTTRRPIPAGKPRATTASAPASCCRKNLLLETREQLLSYVRSHGTESLVIQRMIRGGDGNIFDCYGLCDRDPDESSH